MDKSRFLSTENKIQKQENKTNKILLELVQTGLKAFPPKM